MKLHAFLLLAPLALAACGGGSSATDNTPPSVALARDITAAQGAAPVTAMGDMPRTGTVTYRGAAVFGADVLMSENLRAPGLSAEMRLTANFGNGSLTGDLSGFRDAGNAPLVGAATLNNGRIAANAFGGDFSGTVGGRALDVDMTGRFHGAGAASAQGELTGTHGAEALNGAFIGAK